ncbi:MAG: hypothetical protein AABY22_31735, partial [Nanoarchaeota archaeon]
MKFTLEGSTGVGLGDAARCKWCQLPLRGHYDPSLRQACDAFADAGRHERREPMSADTVVRVGKVSPRLLELAGVGLTWEQLRELIGSDDAASSKPYVSGVRYEPFGKNIAWRSRAESGQADPDALTVMSAASAAAQPPDLQVKWSPPEPSPVYPDGVWVFASLGSGIAWPPLSPDSGDFPVDRAAAELDRTAAACERARLLLAKLDLSDLSLRDARRAQELRHRLREPDAKALREAVALLTRLRPARSGYVAAFAEVQAVHVEAGERGLPEEVKVRVQLEPQVAGAEARTV